MSRIPRLDKQNGYICEELREHILSTKKRNLYEEGFDEIDFLIKEYEENELADDEKNKKKEKEDEEEFMKEVEQELAAMMDDVIGSNEIHSKIFYCEFYIMVSSLVTIVLSIINYEVNFLTSQMTFDNMDVVFTNQYYSIAFLCYLFTTLFTVVLIVNIVIRYKLQILFEKHTKILGEKDDLISSDYYKDILVEIILFIWHPNFAMTNNTLTIDYKNENITESEVLTFKYNDILLAACLFRIFYIFRFLLTISKYKTPRSARVCRLFGEQSSYQFSLVCLFNDQPFNFLMTTLMLFLVFFSYEIRLFESLFNTKRNSYDSSGKPNFNNFFNSIWCTFITMMTVGYGDFYPFTFAGRLLAITASIVGILWAALITVAFFQYLQFNVSENKVFILIERLIIRESYNDLSDNILKKMILNNFYKWKKRTSTPQEIKVLEEKYRANSLEIQQLTRDRLNHKKAINNIDTNNYVMETIIDDIQNLVGNLEESSKDLDNLVKRIDESNKRDSEVISRIVQNFEEITRKKKAENLGKVISEGMM